MEVVVTGLEEVQKALGQDLRPAMRHAAMAIGEAIRGKVAVYPTKRPSTTPGRWYRRGYGPMWRRKDGSIKGRRTSEQLGQRWSVKQKGTGAVVGNAASYSGWVQSAESQAAVHRASGWMTDEKAVEEVGKSGDVERIVGDAVVNEMGL